MLDNVPDSGGYKKNYDTCFSLLRGQISRQYTIVKGRAEKYL